MEKTNKIRALCALDKVIIESNGRGNKLLLVCHMFHTNAWHMANYEI